MKSNALRGGFSPASLSSFSCTTERRIIVHLALIVTTAVLIFECTLALQPRNRALSLEYSRTGFRKRSSRLKSFRMSASMSASAAAGLKPREFRELIPLPCSGTIEEEYRKKEEGIFLGPAKMIVNKRDDGKMVVVK